MGRYAVLRELNRAAGIAKDKKATQRREGVFSFGVVALRADGARVESFNRAYEVKTPRGHAEYRLHSKLDAGSVVFVARVTRDGAWAMAKPCSRCEQVLRNMRVRRVYYTIAPDEYGVLVFRE